MARFGPDLRITDAFVHVCCPHQSSLARVPCSRPASERFADSERGTRATGTRRGGMEDSRRSYQQCIG